MPTYDDVADADLLTRHAGGDPDAFGELVRRHRDRIWAVALRTLGDREEAADAVQDAFISAMRAAGSFRGDAAVTTWLHRIVVNACLDRLRRKAVRPVVPLDENLAVADPRDPIAERETRLEVGAALALLPDEQRLAIVYVDLEGRSVEEAAAILQVAPGTVKSRCSRGRARLAVHLGHLRPLHPAVLDASSDATSAAGNPAGEPGVPPTAGSPAAQPRATTPEGGQP